MALLIDLRVVPSSGRQRIVFDAAGNLKLFLKSPPEDGKANKELVDYLANLLHIPKMSIHIIAGVTVRKKRIKIEAMITREQFFEKLGLSSSPHKQQNLFCR